MNFNSTVKGSALEGFYPAGLDFDKIDACIDAPETITNRQAFWNEGFTLSSATLWASSRPTWVTRSPCRSAWQRKEARRSLSFCP